MLIPEPCSENVGLFRQGSLYLIASAPSHEFGLHKMDRSRPSRRPRPRWSSGLGSSIEGPKLGDLQLRHHQSPPTAAMTVLQRVVEAFEPVLLVNIGETRKIEV